MREIKFRGHDGMDWIYGMTIDHDKETDTHFMSINQMDDWTMVGWVGQYTGLKDTNGNEIYEDDIISTHKGDFVVKWDEIGGMFLFHEIANPDGGIDYYEFEDEYSYYGFHVIGNVYNNPELLKEEE